jgi:hypothetical protein
MTKKLFLCIFAGPAMLLINLDLALPPIASPALEQLRGVLPAHAWT